MGHSYHFSLKKKQFSQCTMALPMNYKFSLKSNFVRNALFGLIVTRTFCFNIPIEIEFGDSIMRIFSRTINKGIELIEEFGCAIVLEVGKY